MSRIHRPYARKPTGPPSVTTVLGALAKDGLPWAAANETASFALNHQDQWRDLTGVQAYDRMRKHHRGVWDHRAALGTLVHSVNEAWTHGETADLEEMVVALQTGSHVWARMSTDQVVSEASVMVDGLEKAWVNLQPETISSEDVVRFPSERQCYIGQSDWRATVPIRGQHRSTLLDLKTTGQNDEKKGFYWDSWRLQLGAYRGCKEIVEYDDDANETSTKPLPPVETCGVLHIRANGEWALHEVAAGGTEHNMFLRLRDIFGWIRSCKDGGVEDRAVAA